MIRTWIVVLLLCGSAISARAQTVSKMPPSNGVVSRDDMTARLEQTARKLGAKGSDRAANVDICWPNDPDEYRGLDKNVVVLISVVSKNPDELPLRRVYTDIDGKVTDLIRLTTMRSEFDKRSPVFIKIGRYREDSFYLAPAGPLMQEGFLKIDFAANRRDFKAYRLPGNPPDFIRNDSDVLPSGRGADPQVLKALLAREYSGFAGLVD